MIRATLDANVVASGFVSNRGALAAILQRWAAGEFGLVLSEHIFRGAERAWRKPYFQARYSSGQVRRTLTLLRDEAIIVTPVSWVQGVGEDEEDDLVLGTAVSGGSKYLVTGDKHLQALLSFQNAEVGASHLNEIVILSPRLFLEELDRAADG